MSDRLYNSFAQALLVRLYKLVASHINLSSGVCGRLYASAYLTYKHFQDHSSIQAAQKLVQPGTLVIDVGANIGFFSLAMHRVTDITILAFEPAPDNFRQLTAVLRTRDTTKRIHPFQLAVSDNNGTALLHLSDLAPTDHKLIPSRYSASVKIETVRLDDFLTQHPEFSSLPISLVK